MTRTKPIGFRTYLAVLWFLAAFLISCVVTVPGEFAWKVVFVTSIVSMGIVATTLWLWLWRQ